MPPSVFAYPPLFHGISRWTIQQCGAPVRVAVLLGARADLGHEENPVIHHHPDSGRVCRKR